MKTIRNVFAVVFLVILIQGCVSNTGNQTACGDIKIVSLHGSWLEMGRQYGKLLKNELRRTYEFSKAGTFADADKFFASGDKPTGIRFLDEFFLGVSQGTGMTIPELIRANAVEVAYADQLSKLLAASKCSTLALWGQRTTNGNTLYGRNYDWLPSFRKLDLVLTVFHPDDGCNSVAMLNFAGCFYLTSAMNSSGLFVELNSGMFSGNAYYANRYPNAWMLWFVLLNSNDIPDACRMLETFKAAGNYVIGLADSQNAIAYEWSADKNSAIVKGNNGVLATANHFCRKGWTNLPGASQGGCISSISRQQALQRLGGALKAPATVKTLENILAVPTGQGGAKWKGTLFQVIAVPSEIELIVNHSDQPVWQIIPLKQYFSE